MRVVRCFECRTTYDDVPLDECPECGTDNISSWVYDP